MATGTATIANPDAQATRDRPTYSSPAAARDIESYERFLSQHLRGEIDDDRFRIIRLNNGIYSQRQGGEAMMVRVKIPYGALNPEQLDLLGEVAESFSRGWGHITTRQNMQFHYVPLRRTPELLRRFDAVGLTTREACGDTVRNVAACHLAGACPFEVLDVTPWAEATFRHLLRHAYAQRLPRKFKINFSGCSTDCGQAAFNDIGVVATIRHHPDGTVERGFRVLVAGGLGANPHPAQSIEEFTEREALIPTIEAVLRTFDHYGNRENKLRARMKWLVDTLGIDELRRRVLHERKLLVASVTWVEGLPEPVSRAGDDPAGAAEDGLREGDTGFPTRSGWATRNGPPGSGPGGVRVSLGATRAQTPYERWTTSNVVRGVTKGTVSANAWCRLGDITASQFHDLATLQRDLQAEVRVTNRQNLVFRGLAEEDLPRLYDRLLALGMAEPGAELARDVVSCPGADTCNLAVTQSRGLAAAVGEALEQAGLADVGGVRVNISGCTNSCGQHHIADIGFCGAERRAHGRAAPGYQMFLGGHLGATDEAGIVFATKALRLPARAVPEAVVSVVGRFAEERRPAEDFPSWLARNGGAKGIGAELAHLDDFPAPETAPEFYVDFGETGPYVADVGIGECAGG